MIYVIEAVLDGQNYFKIGTTSGCPYKRLNQLQRQNIAPLKLVAAMIGDKKDEETFHHVFDFYRYHGEWFIDCKGIRKLISDFPISDWDDFTNSLINGAITFKDVYENYYYRTNPRPA